MCDKRQSCNFRSIQEDDGSADMSEKIDTLHGPVSVMPDLADLIRRFLEAYGEWGAVEAGMARSLIRPGDIVVDGGACLGTFALSVAAADPSRIIAVEPNADILPFLRDNLARLCAADSEIVEAALGESSGEALFHPVPGNAGAGNLFGRSTMTETPDAEAAPRPVPVLPLPAIRALHGDYNFLKLDIEGAAAAALRGDAAYITARQPVVWAECNEDRTALETFHTMRGLCGALHYFAFPCHRAVPYRTPPQPIYPMAYEAALIGCGEDREIALPPDIQGEECIVRPLTDVDSLRQALWLTPRWAMAQWVSLSRPSLIALLGRQHLAQSFDTFLQDSPSPEAEEPDQ